MRLGKLGLVVVTGSLAAWGVGCTSILGDFTDGPLSSGTDAATDASPGKDASGKDATTSKDGGRDAAHDAQPAKDAAGDRGASADAGADSGGDSTATSSDAGAEAAAEGGKDATKDAPADSQALDAKSVDAFTKDASTTFGITVSTAGTGTGTVTSLGDTINCNGTGPACSATTFTDGTPVALTATADVDNTFTGWTCQPTGSCNADCSGTTGKCTVTSGATVKATFAFDNELSVLVTGAGTAGGTVTSADGQINCGGSCVAYTDPTMKVSETLTATPKAGYIFTGWTQGCTGPAATCVMSLAANSGLTHATANFEVAATWDPTFGAAGSYSNGNLTISNKAGNVVNFRTTVPKSAGKWYWEVTTNFGTTSDQGGLGILGPDLPETASWLGSQASGLSFGFAGNDAYFSSWSGTPVTVTSTPPPTSCYVTTGIVYAFALDLDNGYFWAGQASGGGVNWYGGGSPSAGTLAVASGLAGRTVYPGVTLYGGWGASSFIFTANFGQSAFAGAVPAGFVAGF